MIDPEKLPDNARMKRGKRLPVNVLTFSQIPHESLDGLILGLPNGRTYVPMDAEQLKSKIIEAIISNSVIEVTFHPMICKAIDDAKKHMQQYKVINRTKVDNRVIELVEHTSPRACELLRYKLNDRYYYSEPTAEFIVAYVTQTFRKAVIAFLVEKAFS